MLKERTRSRSGSLPRGEGCSSRVLLRRGPLKDDSPGATLALTLLEMSRTQRRKVYALLHRV
jgi:hypothetical protein